MDDTSVARGNSGSIIIADTPVALSGLSNHLLSGLRNINNVRSIHSIKLFTKIFMDG